MTAVSKLNHNTAGNYSGIKSLARHVQIGYPTPLKLKVKIKAGNLREKPLTPKTLHL